MVAARQQLSTPDSQDEHGNNDIITDLYGTNNDLCQNIAKTLTLHFVGI